MTKTKNDSEVMKELLAELVNIKKLLVLGLTAAVEHKLSQEAVAQALGINQASISRMRSPGTKRDNGPKPRGYSRRRR